MYVYKSLCPDAISLIMIFCCLFWVWQSNPNQIYMTYETCVFTSWATSSTLSHLPLSIEFITCYLNNLMHYRYFSFLLILYELCNINLETFAINLFSFSWSVGYNLVNPNGLATESWSSLGKGVQGEWQKWVPRKVRRPAWYSSDPTPGPVNEASSEKPWRTESHILFCSSFWTDSKINLYE